MFTSIQGWVLSGQNLFYPFCPDKRYKTCFIQVLSTFIWIKWIKLDKTHYLMAKLGKTIIFLNQIQTPCISITESFWKKGLKPVFFFSNEIGKYSF